MNRKGGFRSGAFLTELLFVLGAFAICASIWAAAFARADGMSRKARQTGQAVMAAQTLAEQMRAKLPEIGTQNPVWDADWTYYPDEGAAKELGAEKMYAGEVLVEDADGLYRADIRIFREILGRQELLYELKSVWFAGGERQ